MYICHFLFGSHYCKFFRCKCNQCMMMATEAESVCCHEVDKIVQKCKEANVNCLTDHPGFEAVCTIVHVLQTAYHQYRCRYKPVDIKSMEE